MTHKLLLIEITHFNSCLRDKLDVLVHQENRPMLHYTVVVDSLKI